MTTQTTAPTRTGYELLRDPRFNKGTAFTAAERRELGLEGLLPPAVSTVELQVARRRDEIAKLSDDLQKYLVLSDLQTRNETLFFRVLMSDPATYMPIVYTPTVGEACQKFGHIFRQPRGLYIPFSARGRIKELLGNWPEKDVRFIVVTDGERILGLGDLGAGGMGIPLGKLALYTACAGVPPQYSLPIVLDVGTNNHQLVDDPLYLGLRQPRVRGGEYFAFVGEFVEAVQATLSQMLHPVGGLRQFQRGADTREIQERAVHLQRRHSGHRCHSARRHPRRTRLTRQKLVDQRFLFLGAGSAATGIAELISLAMTHEGLDITAARGRNALFDINGLLVSARTDIAEFQKPFVKNHRAIGTFVEAIKALRPTGIIGVSAVPKLFTREVIETMASINERPIIFPYSNPTSRSEATAEEVYRWSAGRAIFASGSPFPPVEFAGRRFVPGQGNNVYIFPAMGMAIYATEAKRVTEELFIIAARALAEQVSDENLASGLIYPPQTDILSASLHVAERIATGIFEQGLARGSQARRHRRADTCSRI